MKIKSMLLLLASFCASVAGAQTYTGTITASDYAPGLNEWAPAISYSITYQADKHLLVECTVAEFNNNNVQLNLEDKGQFEVMNMVDGNNCHYSIVSKDTYEAGTEMNNAFFYLAYPNKASRANFKYVVGASNTEADTEAPVWSSDPVASATASAATIKAVATDNSSSLTYEASATADFATIAATAIGASGKDVTLALSGLTAATEYTYYVRVKDVAGNVSEVKTVTFTTTDAPALDEVTYYGTAGGSDLSQWIDKLDGYYPTITYSATTTSTNQIVFNIKLSEMRTGVTAELWCDQAKSFVSMTLVDAATGEFTATLFDELEKNRGDQINFRFRFPMPGGAPMTQNIFMKVGDSNAKPSEDTTPPLWNADPTTQNVTDKTVEIIVNITDDSASSILTISGDNGFAELTKTVSANGSDQVIALSGLTAGTTYNLTIAVKDAAGNVGESKNVSFTTAEAPNLDALYLTIPIVSTDWSNEGFNPNGTMLVTVNPDNTLSFKASLDQDHEDLTVTNMYVHGVQEPVAMTRTSEGVFECTTTNSITDRTALVFFHMYFVFNGGDSTFAVKNFTPSAGSTSAVADVVADYVKVVAADGVIRVEGSQFAVYTLAGQQVYNGVGEARLDRGVYVVVVDGKAVKVML